MTTQPYPFTATVSSVNSSASSITLLPQNGKAQLRYLWNNSTAIAYVLFGSGTASTSNFTLQMASQTGTSFAYNGTLTVIWASANGTMLCTEVT